VEALTIYWHGFPYNAAHIGGYDEQRQRLWIQNWGMRGNLQLEYSTDWAPPQPPAE
jgi:hypothetical protein